MDKIVKETQKTISNVDLDSARLMRTYYGANGLEDGYVLPDEFILLGASKAGVMEMEFAEIGFFHPRIVVRSVSTGEKLFESSVAVVVHDVHDMFRWVNLEYSCGEETDPQYDDRLDVYWPDSEHADANVVFVHGYNVHPSEAWDWAQAMFKRLWWSGMDAGFTAVLWRGNESQVWVPGKNCYATINYHQNVLNAFCTADDFADSVNWLPGAKKYMVAHSLGNMLVSAARQFSGLEYERYLMLNAAVPIEAYDPTGGVTAVSKFCMTPEKWRPYPDRVRASHWYELFLDDPCDERRTLTWKGLFKDVDNTVNFYSSRDEVVANGDGDWRNPISRKFAWYNQERVRGFYLVSLSPQSGWRFNDSYFKMDLVEYEGSPPAYEARDYTPEETADITNEQLKVRPFFKDFAYDGIYGAGGSDFVATNAYVRWYALSHGIPAESFAAGANPVPKWGPTLTVSLSDETNTVNRMIRNVNMATNCVPIGSGVKEMPWVHSYFIQNSMFETKILFEELVRHIGSTKSEPTTGGEQNE